MLPAGRHPGVGSSHANTCNALGELTVTATKDAQESLRVQVSVNGHFPRR